MGTESVEAFEAAWPDETQFYNAAMGHRTLNALVTESVARARAVLSYAPDRGAMEAEIVRYLRGMLREMRKSFDARGGNVMDPYVVQITPIVDHFQNLLGID